MADRWLLQSLSSSGLEYSTLKRLADVARSKDEEGVEGELLAGEGESIDDSTAAVDASLSSVFLEPVLLLPPNAAKTSPAVFAVERWRK